MLHGVKVPRMGQAGQARHLHGLGLGDWASCQQEHREGKGTGEACDKAIGTGGTRVFPSSASMRSYKKASQQSSNQKHFEQLTWHQRN